MHLLAQLAAATTANPAATSTIQMWHWLAFAAMVTVLLTLDLTVFHKKAHEPSLRESAFWTLFWAALALAFNGVIWWWLGDKPAIEFLTGYLVEWSLSMDNVFVFAVIFGYFRVPLKYQYRVLFWGILGAVLISTLLWARPLNPFVALCACTMSACVLLGMCDDYRKFKEKISDGISGRTKLALQFFIALIAACFIDFDTQLLPASITLPLLWLGLVVNIPGTFTDLQSAVIGAVAGYLILWSVVWMFKFATCKEGMG